MLDSLFAGLLVDMQGHSLLTVEEAQALTHVVKRIGLPDCTSVTMLREEMENHAQLRTLAYFFANRADWQARLVKSQTEAAWMKEYNLCKRDPTRLPGSRFSEAAVTAILTENAPYVAQQSWAETLGYYAQQLRSVADAYFTRGRLLEQLSNNARMDLKLSLEGD